MEGVVLLTVVFGSDTARTHIFLKGTTITDCGHQFILNILYLHNTAHYNYS